MTHKTPKSTVRELKKIFVRMANRIDDDFMSDAESEAIAIKEINKHYISREEHERLEQAYDWYGHEAPHDVGYYDHTLPKAKQHIKEEIRKANICDSRNCENSTSYCGECNRLWQT